MLLRASSFRNSPSVGRSASVTTTLYPARSRAARRASTASRVAWLSIRGRRLPGSTARSWYFSGVPTLTMAHHTDSASHQPLGLVLAERPAGAIGLNHDDLQGIGHGAP